MQVILGAGGTIGKELAAILPSYTQKVRLVSRNPVKVNETDELMSCDLLNPDQVNLAVSGAEVAYLVAGLPYKATVWQNQWPVVMQNVIHACAQHDCKLVFFDNIYMYDRDHLSNMDENTPIRPTSKKGEVRKHIAQMVLDAHNAGKVQALIARAADFYGPGLERNGVLRETVIANLANGKKANWFCSTSKRHSFTYTPDAARGTAMLGNSPDAFGEVWHLPTADSPLTGQEWIDAFASAFGVANKTQLATPFIVSVMGLFIPVMRELKEMLYQYDRDYVFRSDKFNAKFNFTPTEYKTGIEAILAQDYGK